jgi:hypothetical protein
MKKHNQIRMLAPVEQGVETSAWQQAAPEQHAYAIAKARFAAIDAERERRRVPIFEHDFTSTDEELEIRRQLNAELGYWEAYDALLVAERALVVWLGAWLQQRPAVLREHPDLEYLFTGALPIDRREELLMRAARLYDQPSSGAEVEL